MDFRILIRKFWQRSPEYNFLTFFRSSKRGKTIPEYERLVGFPRYKKTTTKFFGKDIKLVDATSFLFLYEEIFEKETYKFVSETNQPFIVEGGANIGLSIIYYKKLYPQAEVFAFEPDPNVFEALQENIKSFGFSGVTLLQKGLWKEDGRMKFYAEGSDGGRIALDSDKHNIVNIDVVSLREYLSKPVDFLNLDIEGSEMDVLESCQDLLKNVKNIFLEYHSFSDSHQSLDRILKVLSAAGFRYQIHHVGIVSEHPFVERKVLNGMDMQLNIFGFRDSKQTH